MRFSDGQHLPSEFALWTRYIYTDTALLGILRLRCGKIMIFNVYKNIQFNCMK